MARIGPVGFICTLWWSNQEYKRKCSGGNEEKKVSNSFWWPFLLWHSQSLKRTQCTHVNFFHTSYFCINSHTKRVFLEFSLGKNWAFSLWSESAWVFFCLKWSSAQLLFRYPRAVMCLRRNRPFRERRSWERSTTNLNSTAAYRVHKMVGKTIFILNKIPWPCRISK